MVPPCALTTAATIARPSPVLPSRRERDESPRANRSNTSGSSVAGYAGAVVGHAQQYRAPRLRRALSDTVTEVPVGVWVRALASRFAST